MVVVLGPLQDTSASPDGRLVAVLGDSSECLVADAQSGKVCVSWYDGSFRILIKMPWYIWQSFLSHAVATFAGNRKPQGAPRLLVLIRLAPWRPRPRHREPGHHLPTVGHAQPLAVFRGAQGKNRRGEGPQVLVGRPVPGDVGGGGLRPRVRLAGRLLERAGDRHLRRDRRHVIQPGHGGPVCRRRWPDVRQPDRVHQEASVRLLRLLSMMKLQGASVVSVCI